MKFFKWPMGFTAAGAEMVDGYSDETSGSSGNGGSGRNSGGNSGPPSNNNPNHGGDGGDGFTITRAELKDYGFSDDIANVFSQSAQLNRYLADYMNAVARAKFEAKYPDKTYINEHRQGDFVFKGGPSDPQSQTVLGRVFQDEKDPYGKYHFSKQEFQAMADHLKFHFQVADQTAEVVIHSKLALPGAPIGEEKFRPGETAHTVEHNLNKEHVPQYVADARVKLNSVFHATVSYTTGDAQQIIIPTPEKNIDYSNTQPIKNFFKWLGRKTWGPK